MPRFKIKSNDQNVFLEMEKLQEGNRDDHLQWLELASALGDKYGFEGVICSWEFDAKTGEVVGAKKYQFRKLSYRETQKGMVAIHDRIDSWLSNGNFEECNRLLSNVNVKSLPRRMVFAFLAGTVQAPRNLLPSRSNLWDEARREYADVAGSTEAGDFLDRLK